MIPKISTGSRTIGLLVYLYGPGLREEHTDPHLVGGWDPAAPDPGRDPDASLAALARLLDQPLAAAGTRRPTSHVWHCSIRAAPKDRLLSDAEWAAIAGRVLAAVGIADRDDPAGCRWVAVRHAADHIHIVATLVREDGRRPDRSFERRKAQATCRAIEKEYGLRQLNPGDGTAAPTAPRAERHAAIRLGRETAPRDQLRTLVRQSLAGSRDAPEFLDRLDEHRVLVRLRRAPSGDIIGYTLALPDHVTAAGDPIWYSGGKLAPDLSWPQITRRLTSTATSVDSAEVLPTPATAAREAADVAWHTAAELTDADDDQAADYLTGTGEILDALATTATGPTRHHVVAAAAAFERATRFHHRAAHAHHQALRHAARQLLSSGPALGRGQDGATSAMLLSALLLLVVATHRWHAAHKHQQQAAAALAAAAHLRAAYGITARPHMAGLYERGLRLAPPVHAQLANAVHSAAAPDLAEQILTDPRWPILAAALATFHSSHPDVDLVPTLRHVIARRELRSADSVIDVLVWRVQRLAEAQNPHNRPQTNSPTHPQPIARGEHTMPQGPPTAHEPNEHEVDRLLDLAQALHLEPLDLDEAVHDEAAAAAAAVNNLGLAGQISFLSARLGAVDTEALIRSIPGAAPEAPSLPTTPSATAAPATRRHLA
ncbi:relaxase/mobilization nuclease domain-containing protein [Streptomyces triticirhizae]|uniref:relaxase/mobilization nuclease domain-containing protein n=1 Tax=Streptomyces triticirhizae TaxID=2483353 RepID=UPI0018F68813|nr:mobilization protein [Streptomyces triticirhizae]